MSESDRSSTSLANKPARAALATLLVVQIVVGYEWLTSGITKIASGTFVSGLAADLKSNSDAAPHFYRSFLHGTIIPNARAFAVLIEIGELIVGVALIVAAIVWLTRWSRLSERWQVSILGVTMLAALGATAMAINFHLASGGNHPWLIPAGGFDETIDLDAVLAFMQMAYVGFCGYLLVSVRHQYRASAVPAESPRGAIVAAA